MINMGIRLHSRKMQPSSQDVGLDEKFLKKTSTDESKGEMLMDCNHMNQATNMGWGRGGGCMS